MEKEIIEVGQASQDNNPARLIGLIIVTPILIGMLILSYIIGGTTHFLINLCIAIIAIAIPIVIGYFSR